MARDPDQTRARLLAAAHFDPVALLSLVQAIATSWESMNPEFGLLAPTDRATRRAVVVSAVQHLLATNQSVT